MKISNTLVLIALSALILSSCTMEKRLYNKGFHVSWNKKYKTSNSPEEKKEILASNRDENPTENRMESSGQSADNSLSDVAFISSDAPEVELEIAQATATTTKHETLGNANEVEVLAKESTSKKQSNKQVKQKAKAKKAADGSSSGGSSQVVALILVILVGVLGIHRFYLGHIGIGILMLLTAGCCGILALVDLIRIITGDLKPKYGEYTETL